MGTEGEGDGQVRRRFAVPPFVPHPLLRNRHAMTAAVILPRWRARRALGEDRLRVFQTRSDTWVAGFLSPEADPRRPLVVSVHGLSGHADSTYMQGLALKARRVGFSTLRMNVRSCGGTEAGSPSLFHAGLTEDLRAILGELRREGFRRFFLVGHSLGGNMVLKLAAEDGVEALGVQAVAAVSPALDLPAASRAIDETPGMAFYRRSFLRDLRAKMRAKHRLFPGRYDLKGLDGLSTIRAFDERFVAPTFGFDGADDLLLPRQCQTRPSSHPSADASRPGQGRCLRAVAVRGLRRSSRPSLDSLAADRVGWTLCLHRAAAGAKRRRPGPGPLLGRGASRRIPGRAGTSVAFSAAAPVTRVFAGQ